MKHVLFCVNSGFVFFIFTHTSNFRIIKIRLMIAHNILDNFYDPSVLFKAFATLRLNIQFDFVAI
ncbi:MAG: hypothetical protein BGP08_21200 [Rhizobiales bacterium 64-17]|nr:MAG: hypothetical protein BGP08_21200 [Rhizobiales bacterium 64-17]